MSQPNDLITTTKAEKASDYAAIGLSAVPYVGGVISGIANNFIQKRKNRRLNDFLIGIAEDLNALVDDINQNFIKTEDFEDLTEDIFSKAAETRQKEKLDAFRAIFRNTVISESPNYDEAAEIAILIHNWQSRHVILLKILHSPLEADKQLDTVVGSGGGIATSISQILKKLLPDWDEDQIDRTWAELYDAKLHRTPGTKTMLTDQGIHQLENRLTEYGQKVARFVAD